jgi:hypothetical protein
MLRNERWQQTASAGERDNRRKERIKEEVERCLLLCRIALFQRAPRLVYKILPPFKMVSR